MAIWQDARKAAPAPDTLVAGPSCVTMAEAEGIALHGQSLPDERVDHVTDCPYCQRTLRLFEAAGRMRRVSFPSRPVVRLAASVAAVAACAFLYIGFLRPVPLQRVEAPYVGTRGLSAEGRVAKASAVRRWNGSVTVVWEPEPGATSYIVKFRPEIGTPVIVPGNKTRVSLPGPVGPGVKFDVFYSLAPP